MKFTSALIEAASGSLGGMTFSHNRGGQYIRGRAVPTNPNSVLQQAVRGYMSQLAAAWHDTLTAAQRLAWDAYGENVGVLDRLGKTIYLTGQNHYIRSNVPRLQAAATRIDDGPTTFNLGSEGTPSFAIDTANDEVDVTFVDTDLWVDEDDSHMLVYASIPNDQTRNFFKGPYQFIGSIDGDSVTPPTTPAAIALPQAIVAGQRNFFQVRTSRADGRLTPVFRGLGDAA